MSLKNYYPELPITPRVSTPATMGQIIMAISRSKFPAEVKRMGYVMIRNESANGTKINNNNTSGIQADSGRWASSLAFAGVFTTKENGTNKVRHFLAFKSLQDCITFTLERIQARGLYVGGYAHKVSKRTVKDAADLADIYKEEWVSGSSLANPSATELASFLSMYRQAAQLFV